MDPGPMNPPAQPPAPISAPFGLLLPGTPQYAMLQVQVQREMLAVCPEPTHETKSILSIPTHAAPIDLAQEISIGEALMKNLGPRVDPSVIQRTVRLKFLKVWIFWRSFRLHDLPQEIINNIFRLVVWSTGHPIEGVRQRLWLTWVCRSWRALAIGDATLWNAIWFRDPPPYERSLEWFRRAGSARIDIRLNERDPQWGQNEDQHKFTAEQMSDLLDKLFVKLPQIRMLVVIVDNWPPAITVLRKLQAAGNSGIPINIERIEIHRVGKPYVWLGPGFESDGHRDPPILNGGQTRLLNHLCLAGVHIDWNDTPLQNLTVLDLRCMPMEAVPTLARFREILLECPMLNRLALDGSGPQPIGKPVDHVPIDLVHLKALILGSFSLPYACFVVSQFNAPHLLDLTLMALNNDDYIPLIRLLTPKFKAVRLLTLYSVQVEITPQGRIEVMRWFQSMPDLAYARIAQLRPSILKLLCEDPARYRGVLGTDTRSGHILCPKLKTLEIQALPYQVIVDFCRRRRIMGVPITKIYLNSPWSSSLDRNAVRALHSVAPVYVAPVGTNTMEENELLDR